MNINEAKTILMLYRPGSADAEDPQIAEALVLAKYNAELARWLDEHCARQEALRGKFRGIAAPAGLKEQIVSEQAAPAPRHYALPRLKWAAGVVAVVLVFALAALWFPRHPADDTLANFKTQMAGVAEHGYYMDVTTNIPGPIRDHLKENQSPSDFVLPAGLAKAELDGCTIVGWQDAKVSMICFRTGRLQSSGQTPDLWLFVVDRRAVPDAPEPGEPKIAMADKLLTACWAQGDKVYLLGVQGDEATIRKFL